MPFLDSTDYLADIDDKKLRGGPAGSKKGFVIQFYHVATIRKNLDFLNSTYSSDVLFGSSATFKAFLTSFRDDFKVNWSSKEVLNMMDPIQSYKNTERVINISIDVPSHSLEEAELNFLHLQNLIQMQYPVYENKVVVTKPTDPTKKQRAYKTRFVSSPPLIYVKMLNWIGNSDSSRDIINTINDVGDALIVTISSVTFNPEIDFGFHISNGNLIPKLFKIELSMTVIHTSELGFIDNFNDERFNLYTFGEGNKPESDQFSSTKYQNYSFPYKTEAYNIFCTDNNGNREPCDKEAAALREVLNLNADNQKLPEQVAREQLLELQEREKQIRQQQIVGEIPSIFDPVKDFKLSGQKPAESPSSEVRRLETTPAAVGITAPLRTAPPPAPPRPLSERRRTMTKEGISVSTDPNPVPPPSPPILPMTRRRARQPLQ